MFFVFFFLYRGQERVGDTEVLWVRKNASIDLPHSTKRKVDCMINHMLGAASDFTPCSSGFSEFSSAGFETSSTKKKGRVEWVHIFPSKQRWGNKKKTIGYNKQHTNPCPYDCFPHLHMHILSCISLQHLIDQTDSLIMNRVEHRPPSWG